VREGIGLFDLSHMGELRLRGEGALGAADHLLTNRLLGTEPGQAVYSPMCREDGGIVDDLIAYHLPDSVLLVINASNIEKDEAWVRNHVPPGVAVENESDATALIAVQGPEAEPFLAPLTDVVLGELGPYTFGEGKVAGVQALVSRTGYTGEDGFELYVPAEAASGLWESLESGGRDRGLLPVGLAARDTLRFEMGYCLYGNDIGEDTNPYEAGLGWTVKPRKGDFVGRESLAAVKEKGPARRLVGLRPEEERIIPRPGYPVVDEEGPVGKVTSGTFAPTLGRGLAMGYVETSRAGEGSSLQIDVRGKRAGARVVKLPFYDGGSRRSAPRKT
jgi:aminomethyltransferase